MSDVSEGCRVGEVGVIPEDWDEERLGKECELITKGTTPTSLGKEFKDDGINFIKIESLEENGTIIKEKVAFIDEETNKLLKRSQLKENDVLVSIAGALGRIAIVKAEILPANTNQALAIVRLKPQTKLNRNYLFYFLNSARMKKHIDAINVQAAQANLSLENINDFTIFIPSLPEQQAIASALSDVDALIAALEQLITKKRNIKQGAMQQLLTGEKRLPGFGGAWDEVRLGNECELITKGTTPTSLGREFKDDGINFIKIESLEENGNIIKEKIAFIDKETHTLLKRSQLKENDILVSIAGALGRIAMVKKDVLPANTNQALALVRLKQQTELNQHFLYYFLHSPQIKNYINNINVQAAQANLSLENINDFKIIRPPFPEQQAIAQILSDMDTEIEALKQKRDKYKAIKQGMMQELLTGKTRLAKEDKT